MKHRISPDDDYRLAPTEQFKYGLKFALAVCLLFWACLVLGFCKANAETLPGMCGKLAIYESTVLKGRQLGIGRDLIKQLPKAGLPEQVDFSTTIDSIYDSPALRDMDPEKFRSIVYGWCVEKP